MKKKMNKSAQQTMGLPFGVIFAIFLIVVFVVIAFIAVWHFLDIGRCAQVGNFYENFQGEINDAWQSQSSEFDLEIVLPSGINKICFANLSADITNSEDYEQIKNFEFYKANTFLVPPEKTCDIPYQLIKHINITEITKNENPYCVSVEEDGVLEIKKDFYDKDVVVR